MTDLVNQTPCVKRSCMHRTLWMLLHITNLIHPVRKLTACRHICEDYVARKGEESSRELVAVSCASRNLKFHHRELVPNQISRSTLGPPRFALKQYGRSPR